LTLREQYDYLCKLASETNDPDDKRRIMHCAHTMFDFWQDQQECFMQDYDDDYRDPVVSKKSREKLYPFRIDERTVAMVPGDARIKDLKRNYQK